MTIEHDVRLSKTIRRLDEVGGDAPEGLAGFAASLDPCDLTVAQLVELRKLQIPATMITTTEGRLAWLLMLYVEKKKGSKSKSKLYFYSRTDQGLLSIRWLSDVVRVLEEEFTLGGWAFPLKQLAEPDIL